MISKEYQREYYKNNKHIWRKYVEENEEKIKEYRKQYWKKYKERHKRNVKQIKEVVLNHYGDSCNCCGEQERTFLTIDHISGDCGRDKYVSGKRIGSIDLCRRIIKLGFPDEYQILCFNCNIGKYLNNNVCPHKDKLKVTY